MPSHCVDHAFEVLGVEDCPACMAAQAALLVVYGQVQDLLRHAARRLEEVEDLEAADDLVNARLSFWAGYVQPLEAWLDLQQMAPDERQRLRDRAASLGER